MSKFIDLDTLEKIIKAVQASKDTAKIDPTEDAEMVALLQTAGSFDPDVALPASRQLAKAVTSPVREGVPHGDIVSDIFTSQKFVKGEPIEYQTFIQADDVDDMIATSIPSEGAIPENKVAGNYFAVQTYEIGTDITTQLRFIRNANFNVLTRLTKWLAASVVRKNNRDGWHTLLAAAQARGISFFDSLATSGVLSKRALNVGMTIMQRNGGGNVNSMNRRSITDFFMSPEGVEDIRNWDLTQIDDLTRREIIMSDENDMVRIFKKFIHSYTEFGDGQEFQVYWTDTLGATIPGSKTELFIAMDLRNKQETFVHPIRAELEVYSNPMLHTLNKFGLSCRAEWGWAVLDSRDILPGGF